MRSDISLFSLNANLKQKDSIVIPKGAYLNNKNLTSLVIPKCVEVIEADAFAGSSLVQVSFEKDSHLREIHAHAFANCLSLKDVNFDSSLKSLFPLDIVTTKKTHINRRKNFWWSPPKESQFIEIGPHAFAGCTSLQKIIIPASVGHIGKEAFAKCGLKEVGFLSRHTLPFLAPGAFRDCIHLSCLRVFDSVCNSLIAWKENNLAFLPNPFIGCTSLFQRCMQINLCASPSSQELNSHSRRESASESNSSHFLHDLQDIFLPTRHLKIIPDLIRDKSSNLDTISNNRWATSLVIPASLFTLRQMTSSFPNVRDLITFRASNLKSISSETFRAHRKITTLFLPSSLLIISRYGFANCTLRQIQFEKHPQLEIIDESSFAGVPKNDSFDQNSFSLKTIIIPQNVRVIGRSAFSWSGLTSICFAPTGKLQVIRDQAFFQCSNLTMIQIPLSVTCVHYGAFFGSNIKHIIFESNSQLISIGSDAFRQCKNLTSIAIPSTVKRIGNRAFAQSALNMIQFESNSSLQILEDAVFEECMSLFEVHFPDSLSSIGSGTFFRSAIQSVIFPNTSCFGLIPNRMFSSCRNLKEIHIPDSVEVIGTSAFAYSTLETILFTPSSKLILIRDNAFLECDKMGSIQLPSSVLTIGAHAFRDSTISSITFLDQYSQFFWDGTTVRDMESNVREDNQMNYRSANAMLQTIGKGCFLGCFQLLSIHLHPSIREIGASAFSQTGLETIEFESGTILKTIEEEVFSDCPQFTSITIPASVISIQSQAFARSAISRVNFDPQTQIQHIHGLAFEGCPLLEVPTEFDLLTKRRKYEKPFSQPNYPEQPSLLVGHDDNNR